MTVADWTVADWVGGLGHSVWQGLPYMAPAVLLAALMVWLTEHPSAGRVVVVPWVEDPLAECGYRYERGPDEPLNGPAGPVAATAGEQDHSDPWRYAGVPAGPPEEVR